MPAETRPTTGGSPNDRLHLQYGYNQTYNSNTVNNGTITGVTDVLNGGRTVNYTYDALNRLKTAVTQGNAGYPRWGLQWTYDHYGNRTAQAMTGSTKSQIWVTNLGHLHFKILETSISAPPVQPRGFNSIFSNGGRASLKSLRILRTRHGAIGIIQPPTVTILMISSK